MATGSLGGIGGINAPEYNAEIEWRQWNYSLNVFSERIHQNVFIGMFFMEFDALRICEKH